MKIVNAEKADAREIGQVVVTAVGEEISAAFAEGKGIEAVITLFANLAAREDSQYSYLYTLKAVDDNGRAMGYVVGYDGALLHRLREAFYTEVKAVLGKDMEGKMGDECEAVSSISTV